MMKGGVERYGRVDECEKDGRRYGEGVREGGRERRIEEERVLKK